MNVQEPSAPAVQLWFRSASIALKEVETSPGDEGGGEGVRSVGGVVPRLADADDDEAGLGL
ncbi:hypothetical protein [Arthrobacter celericrescens]|uniref:hypothetical protein n=1 Tax=Arthrobacter celericrescens TaxID=2320851 RepID=UPI0013C4E84D|nr:hypothetical protein [Arthrobacter celericrescens]